MIDVKNVSLTRETRLVLANITIGTREGRILGLVGPNGAGKSTLLNLMYRILVPSEGDIHIDDVLVGTMPRAEIARKISVVAQQSEVTLPLPVRDSVTLGRLARRNIVEYGNASDQKKVTAALAQVGLTEFADRLTTELSGGELQRVLIARAIVQEASHLLLDEPTNHLDIHHQYLILSMVRQLKVTTVIVLHDLNLAAQFCDDLVLLDKGRIVASGEPFDVLDPARISDVYKIPAAVVHHDGGRHLVFSQAKLASLGASA